jgi:hypothetical protein
VVEMMSDELELTKAALAEVQREYNLAVIEQRNAMLTEANRDLAVAELKAQDEGRLKTIGRLAQDLFDARQELDALKRAQGEKR